MSEDDEEMQFSHRLECGETIELFISFNSTSLKEPYV